MSEVIVFGDQIKYKLDLFDRKFLLMIARRGGRIDFDFSLVTAEVKSYIEKMQTDGILKLTDIIGRIKSKEVALTGVGHNLCSMIEKGELIT